MAAMLFSGGRTPLYSSSLGMLLIISLLLSQTTAVAAIRTLPAAAEEGRLILEEAPAPARSQTEKFREYFNARLQNGLNTTGNATYSDLKRRIPSCPDPLHN